MSKKSVANTETNTYTGTIVIRTVFYSVRKKTEMCIL